MNSTELPECERSWQRGWKTLPGRVPAWSPFRAAENEKLEWGGLRGGREPEQGGNEEEGQLRIANEKSAFPAAVLHLPCSSSSSASLPPVQGRDVSPLLLLLYYSRA